MPCNRVEGGTIGALLAFGAPASLAILAVLAYRLISFWLPTVPGAAAYFQLRRTVGQWKHENDAAGGQPVPALPRAAALDEREIRLAARSVIGAGPNLRLHPGVEMDPPARR